MPLYTSLIDIWNSRPDLRAAFPKGTTAGSPDNKKLNDWWNSNGVNEYPNVTLVPPGDSRIQPPATLTKEAQAGQSPVASPYQPPGQAPGTPATNPATNPATAPRSLDDLAEEFANANAGNTRQGITGAGGMDNYIRSLFSGLGPWSDNPALKPLIEAKLREKYGTPAEKAAPIISNPTPQDPSTLKPAPESPHIFTPEEKAAEQKRIDNLTATGTNPTAPPSNTPPATPSPAKSLYKDSDSYKALSPDLKALVDLAFSTFSGTPEEQKIFTDALTQAQTLSDPYFKAQFSLFKAEFELAIAKNKNDFAAQSEILNRARTDIAADLKLNEDNLSLEQSASIAKELKGYDEDLLTIADQSADKGLTFATGARSRALTEERRTGQFQDVVQSSQRQYNFRVQDLEARAARGDTQAQKELEKLQADQGFNLRAIGQAAEKILGSTGAGNLGIPGFTPQGGSPGSLQQDENAAIIEIAGSAIAT